MFAIDYYKPIFARRLIIKFPPKNWGKSQIPKIIGSAKLQIIANITNFFADHRPLICTAVDNNVISLSMVKSLDVKRVGAGFLMLLKKRKM
jgi:hypothetical protein